MSGRTFGVSQPELLRGFGLRRSVGRRLGVAVFLGAQIAVTAWLMWRGYLRNQSHPVGYAAFAILNQLGLAAVWFFVSTRRSLTRCAAMLCLLAVHGAIIAWHAPNFDDWLSPDQFTSLLSYAGGFWLVPVAAVMDVLRRRGLRVVAIGDQVYLRAPRRVWFSAGLLVAAVPYAAANVAWVNEIVDWVRTERAEPLALVIPQLLCALGVAFVVLGLFAALEHHRAPRSFLMLVTAVVVLWLAVVAMYAARNDLTWVRIRRDSVGAFLGFVPYLHFLWFRALGYRVAYVAAGHERTLPPYPAVAVHSLKPALRDLAEPVI
ncbi:MAG: hypothetical protein WD875_12370, partial [Pirellulales bacterium]